MIASFLIAGWASAASGKQSLALVVEGADADKVRREVTESIPQGIAVQDGGELASAVASAGVRGSIADSLANPRTRKQTLAAIRKALKQVGASAALSARGKRVGKGGAREIRVVLIVRAQAEPMIEENLAIAKGEKANAQLTPLLAVPLQDVANAPAAQAEPEPAAAADKPGKPAASSKETKKDDDEEPLPPSDHDVVAKKRGPISNANAMVIAEGGVDIGTRKMKYQDIVYAAPNSALRAYLQPGIPAWAIGVQLYPAAQQGIPFAKDIGLVAHASQSLVFESKTSDGGNQAKGQWTRYSVGVHGRILAGDKPESPLVGLEATYGDWKYHFTGDDPIVADLPEVEYKYVRAGADVRLPVAPGAAVAAGVGYMSILEAGAFKEKFPHAQIGGVDAHVGGSYAVMPMLEVRAGFTYSRFFSSAKSQPDDAYAIGGAVDEYFTGNIGLAALF